MLSNILNNIKEKFIEDELIGQWHSEDGSGFMIVMGSWMEIKGDGTGEYESWANGNDETSYHFKGKFYWKRIGENKILIQEKESNTSEEIEYELTNQNNRIELTSRQQELGKIGMKAFWKFAQILFKKS